MANFFFYKYTVSNTAKCFGRVAGSSDATLIVIFITLASDLRLGGKRKIPMSDMLDKELVFEPQAGTPNLDLTICIVLYHSMPSLPSFQHFRKCLHLIGVQNWFVFVLLGQP